MTMCVWHIRKNEKEIEENPMQARDEWNRGEGQEEEGDGREEESARKRKGGKKDGEEEKRKPLKKGRGFPQKSKKNIRRIRRGKREGGRARGREEKT